MYPFVSPSVCPSVVCPSVLPSVRVWFRLLTLSITKFEDNSAATDQKLFIFGMGVPWRVLFHSTSDSMDPWVMPQGGARGQNLGHPNKVVYCSLFIQPLIKEGWASDMFITSTFSVIRSRSLWLDFHASAVWLTFWSLFHGLMPQ